MLAALLLSVPLACRGADAPVDPLPAELARASALVAGGSPQAREANEPILRRAEEDVRQGRRQLALQRLVNLYSGLAARSYLVGIPAAQREQMASLDAEWKRLGTELAADLAPATPGLFDGVAAAPRALAEAARSQVRGYYHGGIEFAHATMADEGFYYLGEALGQRETVSFCRKFPAPADLRQPSIRSIQPELEALENDMLAVYRPPVSTDHHGEFIEAGSSLKEARELDAAGQHYGALLRYLQAAQAFAPLRPDAPAPLTGEALAGRLREHAERLKTGGIDHSLGELFLELAQAEAAGSPATASVLATDVLPRYFAALAPASPAPPRPAPQLAVTLVRWPYT